MTTWFYILVLTGATALALCLTTGWWRLMFLPFTIRPRRMTVARRGLMVSSPQDVDRVDTILKSFVGGFNAMITKRSSASCQTYCDSLPVIYRPFAQEGLAMGYTLRHLFRYDSESFERTLVKVRPEFRYLHYVGLGFWSGMRNHNAEQIARRVAGLDPLHGYLCYDGYGFQRTFFEYPRNPHALNRLASLSGYASNAAHQGVGRALWFLYMDRPDLIVKHTRRLGEYAPDAAAGIGLASVFVNPDRLESARALALSMPTEWHDHVHLGMCFAIKARSINDLDAFERYVTRLEPNMQEAVYASIRECDRVELQVRADSKPEAYRRWRRQVTDWMRENIEFPLAGLRSTNKAEPRALASYARRQGSAREDTQSEGVSNTSNSTDAGEKMKP